MSYLFNRVASVQIGPEKSEGKLFKDLRITFDITKTIDSDSNSAKISITNLNETSRSFIKEDHVTILKAGYTEDSGEEILFVGNISLVTHQIEPPNITTKIESKDGGKFLRENKISVSYKPGITTKQILTDISKKTNIGNKLNLGLLRFDDKQFTNGYTFLGQTKYALDMLCNNSELEWSIQNGELKIQRKDSGDTTRAIYLSSNTGLIGSPEKVSDISKGETKTQGWIFNTLLMPKAEPGGIIVLNSKNIKDGTKFKIHEVTHIGDTHGKDWNSKIKAVEL